MLCNHDSYLDQLTGRLGGKFVKALSSLFSEYILRLCCCYEKVGVSGVLSLHVRVLCRVVFFFWDISSAPVLLNVNTNCEHTQRCEHKGQCRDDFIWGHLHEKGKRKGG